MGKARNTRLWNISTNRPWNVPKSYAIVDYDVEFYLSTLRKALRILPLSSLRIFTLGQWDLFLIRRNHSRKWCHDSDKIEINSVLIGLLKGASGCINSLFTLKYSLLRYYRDNLKFYVQPPKSDLLRSCFSNRASILWNNLSAFLKSKPNLESFKCALKANSDMLDETSFNGS